MKLVVLLSIAALVACDYSAPQPEKPSDVYATPDRVEGLEETSAPIEPGKSFFGFNNVYRGAFPPSHFAPANFFSAPSFHSFGHPFKSVNFAASPQGILPPFSQIVPPQISQIVPPISQIVPPVFGNAKPAFPSPVLPSQVFPPVTAPLLNKFTFPYYSLPYQHSYAFPSVFPSAFSLPPSDFYASQIRKQPSKANADSPSTSYGPPVSGPAEPEPSGPAETSAPFEPAPVSFPYEPAAPEAQEPTTPHKPAQEYGPPAK